MTWDTFIKTPPPRAPAAPTRVGNKAGESRPGGVPRPARRRRASGEGPRALFVRLSPLAPSFPWPPVRFVPVSAPTLSYGKVGRPCGQLRTDCWDLVRAPTGTCVRVRAYARTVCSITAGGGRQWNKTWVDILLRVVCPRHRPQHRSHHPRSRKNGLVGW